VKILEENKISYSVINYIKDPPSIESLNNLAHLLNLRPKDFIRTKDKLYEELKVEKYIHDDQKLFSLINKHPKLLERPIAIKGKKAIICRPSEKILDLF